MLKLLVSMSAACTVLASEPARASGWGCEVLLCAASDNPTWQGVPSCHPPMDRLMSAMKRPGFSWPTCPEGGASKPGYEPFEQCPAGWTPSAEPQGGDNASSGELSRCSRTVEQCGWGGGNGGGEQGQAGTGSDVTRIYSGENSCQYTEFMARPRREKPYFFDITGEEGRASSRHYFSLGR